MFNLRPCWSQLQSDSLTALRRPCEELLPLGVSWLAAHEAGSENFLLASCPDITFKRSMWGHWNLPLLLCFLIWQLLSSRSKLSHCSHPGQPGGAVANTARCTPSTVWDWTSAHRDYVLLHTVNLFIGFNCKHFLMDSTLASCSVFSVSPLLQYLSDLLIF